MVYKNPINYIKGRKKTTLKSYTILIISSVD